MSRFHLTTNRDSHVQAKGLCNEADLDSDSTLISDGIYLSSYRKRTVQAGNCLELDNESFVVITGTLIVDGKLGEEALSRVFEIYSEDGASGVREAAFGHYACIIRTGKDIVIFGDPNGVYEIYYTDKEEWFVSNSLQLCGSSLAHRRLDRHGFNQRAIEYCEISDTTLFQDCRRLGPREKLVINPSDSTLSVQGVHLPEKTWDYAGLTEDEVLVEYTRRTRETFDEIVEAAESLTVQATGGLDSRTVLAGILEQEAEPIISYGVGNSSLTNTKSSDLEVTKECAERYSLPFNQMNWEGDYPIGQEQWDELFTKFGFRYNTYGATPNFFASLTESPVSDVDLVLSGYGFGTFSNSYFWEDESIAPIEFQDAVADIFTQSSKFDPDEFVCRDEYVPQLVGDCQRWLANLGEDVEKETVLDIDHLTRIIQLLNGRPQSAYVNVANEFSFHISPFATYRLGRSMVDFPREFREGERIRVRLVEELYPDLLNVPLFSGGERKQITKQKQLTVARTSKLWYLRLIRNVLPDRLVRLLLPIYRKYDQYESREGVDETILQTDIRRLDDGGHISGCFDLQGFDGDIRAVSRLALYEHAVNRIGFQSITEESNSSG